MRSPLLLGLVATESSEWIKLKARLLGPAAIGVVLAGCQSSEPVAQQPIPITVPRKVTAVDKPRSVTPTKIGLVVRRGLPITVGFGSPSKAFDPFRDPKQFVSEFNDLPAKFEYPYTARTWETGKMGLGEILYDGDLVAAVYHQDQVTQDRVDEIVAAHGEQIGRSRPDTLVTSKRVQYWFWQIETQRLMICAYQKDQKGIELTVAMGDEVVMDGLGMSPAQADIDKRKVDEAAEKGTGKAISTATKS